MINLNFTWNQKTKFVANYIHIYVYGKQNTLQRRERERFVTSNLWHTITIITTKEHKSAQQNEKLCN